MTSGRAAGGSQAALLVATPILVGDVESAKTASKILGELLLAHTHREQVGLFAEMKKDELFTEHIASLCAEHDELDADVELIAAGDLTRIPIMITLLNNHIDREENGLLPAPWPTLTAANGTASKDPNSWTTTMPRATRTSTTTPTGTAVAGRGIGQDGSSATAHNDVRTPFFKPIPLTA